MVQDESVGFVQGTSFRSGNHCALRALVSRIQIEFSGLGPRDLVQMMAERGIALTHTTILRWVQRFVPEFEKRWSQYSRPVGRSWRCDETYIKVKGRWTYLYRAVDKQGRTVDFLLSGQ
jgi:transposase-like protein